MAIFAPTSQQRLPSLFKVAALAAALTDALILTFQTALIGTAYDALLAKR